MSLTQTNVQFLILKMRQIPLRDFLRWAYPVFQSTLCLDKLLSNYDHQEIHSVSFAHGKVKIYKIYVAGYTLAVFNAQVGAPACLGLLENLYAAGMESLVLFGTCRVLDESINDIAIVIPHSAIRDEGASYHYQPAEYEIGVS